MIRAVLMALLILTDAIVNKAILPSIVMRRNPIEHNDLKASNASCIYPIPNLNPSEINTLYKAITPTEKTFVNRNTARKNLKANESKNYEEYKMLKTASQLRETEQANAAFQKIKPLFYSLLKATFEDVRKRNYYIQSAEYKDDSERFAYTLRCIAVFEFGNTNLAKAEEFARLAAKFDMKQGAMTFAELAHYFIHKNMSIKDLNESSRLIENARILYPTSESGNIVFDVYKSIKEREANLSSELVAEYNKHQKALAMLLPQKTHKYSEKNTQSKSQDIAYHNACLQDILQRLGGGFTSKKAALFYHNAYIKKLENINHEEKAAALKLRSNL